MKKLIFSFVLSFIALTTFAQHETLFNKAKVRGGFGGPIYTTSLKKGVSPHYMVGGGGAIIVNNFFIGGYGLGSVDIEKVIVDEDIDILEIGHGGLWLGATFPAYKVVHGYASTRLGWGAMNLEFDDPDGNPFVDADRIRVIEPEVGLELNVFQWFRVAGTVGYRWTTGVREQGNLSAKNFSGAFAGLTLRFGWFGWKRW